MERVRLTGLDSFEYEHPLDVKLLNALRKTPLFSKILEVIGTPFNAVKRISQLGSNIRVTERQLPKLHRMMCEACEILDVDVPLFYVDATQEINAFASSPDNPVVTLYSGLIDHYEDDELMFIIGHELSHIKSKHLIYHQMGELIAKGTLNLALNAIPGFGVVALPAQIALQYAYFEWSRASEFTCDRAGYLACQDFDASCRALMKLGGSTQKYNNVLSLDEFKQQAREFQDIDANALGKAAKILLSFELTHPWTVLRVKQLMEFHENGEYLDVLNRKTKAKRLNESIAGIMPDTRDGVLRCGKCGNELNKDALFCRECGSKVETAHCKKCGAIMKPDAVFCSICGTKTSDIA
jgi:Zn-dependent protease with chaperone function/ribosomal protein L40E